VQKKKGHFFALFFKSQSLVSLSLLPYFLLFYIVCFCCLTSSLSLSFRKQQTAATANANAGATNTTGEGGGGGGEKTTKTKTKKQCSSVYRGVRQRPWGRCVRKKNSRTKKKEIVSVGSFFLSLRKRRYFCSLTSLSFLSLSFILKKKMIEPLFNLSLFMYIYLSLTFFSRRRAR
jgi:hypothetical protein